jgi:hypothetical protein
MSIDSARWDRCHAHVLHRLILPVGVQTDAVPDGVVEWQDRPLDARDPAPWRRVTAFRRNIFHRHCEEPLRRSNPALPSLPLDCFAPLAMTWRGWRRTFPPSLRGALATKQSSSPFFAPGLLRRPGAHSRDPAARNDAPCGGPVGLQSAPGKPRSRSCCGAARNAGCARRSPRTACRNPSTQPSALPRRCGV